MKKYGNYDDKALFRMTANGDERAFEELLLRYEKLVYNVAYGVTKNREDAFDASQEALCKLWRTANRYRGDCEVSSWIYTIAKNAALDLVRARDSRAAMSITPDDDDVRDTLPSGDDTPEEAAIRREEADAVREAIESLSAPHREVIELRELYSMSYREIADAVGVDIGTVKSRLSRARDELYAALSEKFRDNHETDGTKSPPAASKRVKDGDVAKGGERS